MTGDLMFGFIVLLGPVIGVFAGDFGARRQISNANTQIERRHFQRMRVLLASAGIGLVAATALFLAELFSLPMFLAAVFVYVATIVSGALIAAPRADITA